MNCRQSVKEKQAEKRKWKKENSKESSAGVAVHLSEKVGCTKTINHVEMNHDSPVNFVTKGKKDGWDNNCEDFSVLNYGLLTF